MKFIIVTTVSGVKIHINPDHIIMITEDKSNQKVSKVYITNGDFLRVKGSPEDVAQDIVTRLSSPRFPEYQHEVQNMSDTNREYIVDWPVVAGIEEEATNGELVRCKDCEHRFDGEHNDKCCDVLMQKAKWAIEIVTDDDWFCADGERRRDT